MKLKLTLRRTGFQDVDLLATLDVSAKVADLAAMLAEADPRLISADAATRTGVGPTLTATGPVDAAAAHALRVVAPHPVDLDPEASVGDSDLRSGMTVSLAGASLPAAVVPRTGSTVILLAIAGPDRGKEFRLPRGTAVVGRDSSCAVRLTDTLVSRRHAQITVGEHLEITDLGSANGLEIGSGTVSRALLRTGDTFRVGDTELHVLKVESAGYSAEESEGFNRPPRLSPVYQGEELLAPQPPQPAKASRIPIVPLFTPLLLGAVLYLTTHSATSLVFVGLSPLMAVGYAVETGRAARKDFKNEVAGFRAAVAELTAKAGAAAEREADARRREHPSLDECADAIRSGTALLWARRPGEPGFGELRLATGTLPARNTIALPDSRAGAADLVAELEQATAPFRRVEGVPVAAVPAEQGAIGLAGDRAAVLGVARSLVIQAAALHSPAELLVTAFASAQTAPDWDWLKWLPHGTAGQGTLTGHRFAATATDAAVLMSKLESIIAGRAGGASELPLVLTVIEDDTPVERSRLVALAERGRHHGVYVLWLSDRQSGLPAACRIFATVDAIGAVAGFADAAQSVGPLAFERLDARTALDLALRLAPRTDTGARGEDSSDLPRAVSLLAVGDQQQAVSALAIIERWSLNRSIVTGPYAPPPGAKRSKKPGTLRAVIGTSASGVHALDLRADGPHALVGGTTGSGKSELLQSWILAMAAAHSPQRLTFLLVDYKGGSAFGELKELPHTVGLVTDLDQHEVRRSLVSLAAELKTREKHFAKHRVKDLIELELRGRADAPPSLVIVVDEFAALVKELPEFVDGVINVAQRGRSLGVHLILATQRPAGVISDNLRANTNLRLALRMADEADSLDVLGSREAAYFDQDLPGRAVSKTGPGRLVPFQVGYAGGWTPEEAVAPEIQVEELRFGVGAEWRPENDDHTADSGATDLQRLVGAIRAAQAEAQLEPPRQPWLPPLASLYDFTDQVRFPHTGVPNSLVFGLCDDPENQAQPPAAFHPDTHGNLAVYGTGGSGKSTLLRTIAAAAGRVAAIDPTHVYGLDFGSRGLAMLEELPHVGNIISNPDQELVVRLMAWLRDLVADRAGRYAAAEVNTITDYRKLAGPEHAAEPRILLLVDGMAAFRQAYEVGPQSGAFDQLCSIAAEGRPVGVHVLITADRAASVPSALATSMQTRVVLRLADTNEYPMLGAALDVLKPTSPPGRGLLRGAEVQVAVLGNSSDVGVQAQYMRRLAISMGRAGVAPAPAVARVPERKLLSELPEQIDGKPVLGLRIEDLSPQTFVPSGSFIVSGAPASGRTATLRTLAVALRRWDPRIRMYFFASRPSELAGLPFWADSASTVDEAAELAKKLNEERVFDAADRPAAMFIEGFMEFVNSSADIALTSLARACVNSRALLVAETESSAVTNSGSTGLQGPVKSSRTGVALAPLPPDGFNLFRTNFSSRVNPADFPPGRALFVTGGKMAAVQIAWTDEH